MRDLAFNDLFWLKKSISDHTFHLRSQTCVHELPSFLGGGRAIFSISRGFAGKKAFLPISVHSVWSWDALTGYVPAMTTYHPACLALNMLTKSAMAPTAVGFLFCLFLTPLPLNLLFFFFLEKQHVYVSKNPSVPSVIL